MLALSQRKLFYIIAGVWGGLLLYLKSEQSLAGDELWGAMHGYLNPVESLLFTLRFDLHPPLYYSQLNLWTMVSSTDLWLRLNSYLWLVATAGLVFEYCKKQKNDGAIWLAVCLLVLPVASIYGVEIRMYSFLMFLAVLGFLLTEKLLREPQNGKLYMWIGMQSLIAVYSHGAGFLIVMSQFVYGLFVVSKKEMMVKWWKLHIVVGLLSLPLAVFLLFKTVSHTMAPSSADILDGLFLLASGQSSLQLLSGLVCFILFMGVVWVTFSQNRKSIRILIAYLLVPIVFSILVSYGLKPFWLHRNFIYSIPLLVIGFSLSWSAKPSIVIKSIVIAACFISMFQSLTIFHSSDRKNYRDIALNFIQDSDSECLIVEDTLSSFWAIAHYSEVEWGNALDVQGDINQKWQRIIMELPELVQEKLLPNSNYFLIKAKKVYAGKGPVSCSVLNKAS